jgi:hypothetical protein
MSQPTMTPRQKQALKTKEAADQRNKLKVALGAGGIGAVTGLFLPIVGGVTLAACGCAAAVGLTTRSDDVGEAARASGQAAASSAEKLGDAFRRNGAREKFLDGVRKTRETLETALKGGGEEPLRLEGQQQPAKKDKGWLARWRGETEAEKREKLDGYGAAGTASEAAALMCRDLAETPPGQRRRVALCVEINHWFGGSPPNFRTLYLDQIEVDSADFWTNRLLSSRSRSSAEDSGAIRSITRTLKSG